MIHPPTPTRSSTPTRKSHSSNSGSSSTRHFATPSHSLLGLPHGRDDDDEEEEEYFWNDDDDDEDEEEQEGPQPLAAASLLQHQHSNPHQATTRRGSFLVSSPPNRWLASQASQPPVRVRPPPDHTHKHIKSHPPAAARASSSPSNNSNSHQEWQSFDNVAHWNVGGSPPANNNSPTPPAATTARRATTSPPPPPSTTTTTTTRPRHNNNDQWWTDSHQRSNPNRKTSSRRSTTTTTRPGTTRPPPVVSTQSLLDRLSSQDDQEDPDDDDEDPQEGHGENDNENEILEETFEGGDKHHDMLDVLEDEIQDYFESDQDDLMENDNEYENDTTPQDEPKQDKDRASRSVAPPRLQEEPDTPNNDDNNDMGIVQWVKSFGSDSHATATETPLLLQHQDNHQQNRPAGKPRLVKNGTQHRNPRNVLLPRQARRQQQHHSQRQRRPSILSASSFSKNPPPPTLVDDSWNPTRRSSRTKNRAATAAPKPDAPEEKTNGATMSRTARPEPVALTTRTTNNRRDPPEPSSLPLPVVSSPPPSTMTTATSLVDKWNKLTSSSTSSPTAAAPPTELIASTPSTVASTPSPRTKPSSHTSTTTNNNNTIPVTTESPPRHLQLDLLQAATHCDPLQVEQQPDEEELDATEVELEEFETTALSQQQQQQVSSPLTRKSRRWWKNHTRRRRSKSRGRNSRRSKDMLSGGKDHNQPHSALEQVPTAATTTTTTQPKSNVVPVNTTTKDTATAHAALVQPGPRRARRSMATFSNKDGIHHNQNNHHHKAAGKENTASKHATVDSTLAGSDKKRGTLTTPSTAVPDDGDSKTTRKTVTVAQFSSLPSTSHSAISRTKLAPPATIRGRTTATTTTNKDSERTTRNVTPLASAATAKMEPPRPHSPERVLAVANVTASSPILVLPDPSKTDTTNTTTPSRPRNSSRGRGRLSSSRRGRSRSKSNPRDTTDPTTAMTTAVKIHVLDHGMETTKEELPLSPPHRRSPSRTSSITHSNTSTGTTSVSVASANVLPSNLVESKQETKATTTANSTIATLETSVATPTSPSKLLNNRKQSQGWYRLGYHLKNNHRKQSKEQQQQYPGHVQNRQSSVLKVNNDQNKTLDDRKKNPADSRNLQLQGQENAMGHDNDNKENEVGKKNDSDSPLVNTVPLKLPQQDMSMNGNDHGKEEDPDEPPSLQLNHSHQTPKRRNNQSNFGKSPHIQVHETVQGTELLEHSLDEASPRSERHDPLKELRKVRSNDSLVINDLLDDDYDDGNMSNSSCSVVELAHRRIQRRRRHAPKTDPPGYRHTFQELHNEDDYSVLSKQPPKERYRRKSSRALSTTRGEGEGGLPSVVYADPPALDAQQLGDLSMFSHQDEHNGCIARGDFVGGACAAMVGSEVIDEVINPDDDTAANMVTLQRLLTKEPQCGANDELGDGENVMDKEEQEEACNTSGFTFVSSASSHSRAFTALAPTFPYATPGLGDVPPCMVYLGVAWTAVAESCCGRSSNNQNNQNQRTTVPLELQSEFLQEAKSNVADSDVIHPPEQRGRSTRRRSSSYDDDDDDNHSDDSDDSMDGELDRTANDDDSE